MRPVPGRAVLPGGLGLTENCHPADSLLLTNAMCVFSSQSMWIERTIYTTAYKLPGILRWFEVKSVFMVRRPPQEGLPYPLSSHVQHTGQTRLSP